MSDIGKLRQDFAAVRAWMVEVGEWTEAQAAEIGQAIKDAVAEADAGYLAFWAAWFDFFAEVVIRVRAELAALYQRELDRLKGAPSRS